jgi:hypothetical protein
MAATTIERRVARLEATTDGGGKCPECGGPDDRPPRIVFVDPGDAKPDEWCGTCGRALATTVFLNWGPA